MDEGGIIVFCWRQEGKYLAMSKENGQALLDPLLRWFWIEMGDPMEEIPSACLEKALNCLVNPIRVMAERACCCGFDPGYLLYAMARSQHPQVHESAELF